MAYDTEMLTSQKAISDFFEAVVALGAEAKQAANWIMGEVMRALSERDMDPARMALSPATLARLIALVREGVLNRNTAVKVFEALFDSDGDVDEYVKCHGLEQIRDEGLVERTVEQVFAQNPKSVADYHAGKEKALGFLVGQVMRELKGKADPQTVNAAVRARLGS